MGMTLLEQQLQKLTNDFDTNTTKAANMLREISRDAFGAKPLNDEKINQAMALTSDSAKDTANQVVDLIKRVYLVQ